MVFNKRNGLKEKKISHENIKRISLKIMLTFLLLRTFFDYILSEVSLFFDYNSKTEQIFEKNIYHKHEISSDCFLRIEALYCDSNQ